MAMCDLYLEGLVCVLAAPRNARRNFADLPRRGFSHECPVLVIAVLEDHGPESQSESAKHGIAEATAAGVQFVQCEDTLTQSSLSRDGGFVAAVCSEARLDISNEHSIQAALHRPHRRSRRRN